MKIVIKSGMVFDEILRLSTCRCFVVLRNEGNHARLYASPMDDQGWYAVMDEQGRPYWRAVEDFCCEKMAEIVVRRLRVVLYEKEAA